MKAPPASATRVSNPTRTAVTAWQLVTLHKSARRTVSVQVLGVNATPDLLYLQTALLVSRPPRQVWGTSTPCLCMCTPLRAQSHASDTYDCSQRCHAQPTAAPTLTARPVSARTVSSPLWTVKAVWQPVLRSSSAHPIASEKAAVSVSATLASMCRRTARRASKVSPIGRP